MYCILSSLAFASLAQAAVKITLFDLDQDDCYHGGASVTCNDFPQGTNQCCDNGIVVSGPVLFNGLDTQDVAEQGIVYTDSNGDSCGTSCNAGFGQNLCLTCPHGIDGANWVRPQRPAKRSEGPCRKIKPDQMTFANRRSFNINYAVPADVTETLLRLMREDPYLEEAELSPEVLAHERGE